MHFRRVELSKLTIYGRPTAEMTLCTLNRVPGRRLLRNVRRRLRARPDEALRTDWDGLPLMLPLHRDGFQVSSPSSSSQEVSPAAARLHHAPVGHQEAPASSFHLVEARWSPAAAATTSEVHYSQLDSSSSAHRPWAPEPWRCLAAPAGALKG